MARQLRVFAAVPEDWSWVSSSILPVTPVHGIWYPLLVFLSTCIHRYTHPKILSGKSVSMIKTLDWCVWHCIFLVLEEIKPIKQKNGRYTVHNWPLFIQNSACDNYFMLIVVLWRQIHKYTKMYVHVYN